MPRKTAEQKKQEQEAAALAQRIEEAIADLPFSPEHDATDPRAFGNLPEPVQAGIAESIFRDFRLLGKSGADCRKKYGGTDDATDGTEVGLSGKRRRIVLRAFGFGAGVARSYDAYADGQPRIGSAHARTHGALAQQRAADAAAAQAQAQADAASLPECRKALRDAGEPVPSVRKGDEKPLRAAYAALLLSRSAQVA